MNNQIKMIRTYHVQWNNITSQANIIKLKEYLRKFNTNAKSTDKLYINMPEISPDIINTLNIELNRMSNLNYAFLIRIPNGFVTKYLDVIYWNNGFITDCRTF